MKTQYANGYGYIVIDAAPNGKYEVASVHVHEHVRRQGHFTTLMGEVVADADREGAVLYLCPVPFAEELTRDALAGMYEKFGFQWWGGSGYMERYPCKVPGVSVR